MFTAVFFQMPRYSFGWVRTEKDRYFNKLDCDMNYELTTLSCHVYQAACIVTTVRMALPRSWKATTLKLMGAEVGHVHSTSSAAQWQSCPKVCDLERNALEPALPCCVIDGKMIQRRGCKNQQASGRERREHLNHSSLFLRQSGDISHHDGLTFRLDGANKECHDTS